MDTVVDLRVQAPRADSASTAKQINGDDQNGDSKSRAEYASQIKSIESALAQLQDIEEFSDVRASLKIQMETAKQKIISSRPLSARLTGCRGAVERAQKRRQTAVAALELAQAAFKEADDSASKKETELKSLEAEAGPNKDGQTCLEVLENNMKLGLQEMDGGGRIEQGLIGAAHAQMASLFQGLTIIAKQCDQPQPTPTQPQPDIMQLLGAVHKPPVCISNDTAALQAVVTKSDCHMEDASAKNSSASVKSGGA